MITLFAMLVTVISGVARIQTRIDPITDVSQTLAGVANGQNHLALVCDPPKAVTVNLAGDQFLGTIDAGILAGGADVVYRFDQEQPVQSRASLNQHTLILASGENIPFMLRMKHASSLYLRVTKFDGYTADFQVNFAGFEPAIDQVLAACGFAPDGRRMKQVRTR